ncbi:MAG: phytoene desaturase family protein [Candidatus Omnitrophota bacterium]
MSKKIAIVGAGVGGLATAARLAKRGFEVNVYEKLPECGGRNHMLEDKGFKFDMGPSFVLMPDFFREVFSYCGQRIQDYLDLKMLDVHYKIFYPDNESLTVFADQEKTREQLKRMEVGGHFAYDRLIAETEKIYNAVKPLLYECFSPKDLLNPAYWMMPFKMKVFETYWKLVRRFFKSDKLCYALTFEAMFMGVSPFQTPAFYSIITYSDHVQKVFHPMGGMYQIPRALEQLGGRLGVKYHYNSEINHIEKKGNVFYLASGAQVFEADRVVINADYAYAQEELLKRQIPKYQYSCSTYLLYLGLRKKIKGLYHHNLFFSSDLPKNLKQIFETGEFSQDPSFYVHVPTVTDSSLAPEGKDLVYVLVPVPNLQTQMDIKKHEEELRAYIFRKMRHACLEDIESLIEVEHKFYPQDFISRYHIKFGATFGLSHNLMQSAFFRPLNYDQKMPGLYYVGASTQPGGGLPPVLAGSRIVADLICSA